jgi:pimeloyl-ACP methyl ester carboxylesterase
MMKFTQGVRITSLIIMGLGTACAQSAATTPVAAHPLEAYAKPQRLVKLSSGRQMNILCVGSGSPTVLLEVGAGDSNWVWTPVQRRVAQTNRVCSYDRAGFGFSDFANEPRTPAHIAADLTALLKTADIKGPYVMVGHSAGGIYVRAFTDMHRKDVVGMVLVDPAGIGQDKRFEAEIPGDVQRHADGARFFKACAAAATSGNLQQPSPPASVRPCLYMPRDPSFPASFNVARKRIEEAAAHFRTIVSEAKEENSTNIASAPGSYGDMPLIVLTASNSAGASDYTPEEVTNFKQIWNAQHAEMAALSSRGVHRQVPDASHYVIVEKPDVIVAAIAEVVAAASK